jgi:2,3-bisphosphoglycerate-independent phosphoglycerate mutase
MNKMKPLVLMILDGWGEGENCPRNAISLARPDNFYRLRDKYPDTCLNTSGKFVGLPWGQMGNSEVGHLNMGAGRIVYQEITRINNAIEDGTFFANPAFLAAAEQARSQGGALHLMGLVSDGGVHSHLDHIYALLEFCQRQNLPQVYLHAFLDGRDTDPHSGMEFVERLQNQMQELGIGKIATIMGRFYAMDRDKRWNRVKAAYEAMVTGKGKLALDALTAIEQSYQAGVSDEFVEPVVVLDEYGIPRGTIKDGDSIIFFNFRADRAREISHALTDVDFTGFERLKCPAAYYVGMTQYDITLKADVAFVPQSMENTLGEWLARHGLKQLRIAETEKYAHVTFFFNGGVEQPNPGEDRILIPSPPVETYDQQPEMSAREVTDRVIEEIERDYYQVIILNYANPDMIGHTGNLPAAVKAIETVDTCLQEVVEKVLEKEGIVLITADHGNCEEMVCPRTGACLTAHTTNQVPLILVSEHHRGCSLKSGGSLQDIAPTMLKLLGMEAPPEMTGQNLVESG